MIRSVDLICSRCGKSFVPKERLFYQDDFTAAPLKDTKFICDECMAKWHDRWKIKDAVFSERDYVLTVDITLEDGTRFEHLDATPIEETGTVVTGEDIPEEAAKDLFARWEKFAAEKEKKQIKDCFFEKKGEGYEVSFTTVGGEKHDHVPFSIKDGYLILEEDVDEDIMEGIVTAYKSYLSQETMLGTSESPAAASAARRKRPRPAWPGTGPDGKA